MKNNRIYLVLFSLLILANSCGSMRGYRIEAGAELNPEKNYIVAKVDGSNTVELVGDISGVFEITPDRTMNLGDGLILSAIMGATEEELRAPSAVAHIPLQQGEYAIFEVDPGTYTFGLMTGTLDGRSNFELSINAQEQVLFTVFEEDFVTYIGDIIFNFDSPRNNKIIIEDNFDNAAQYVNNNFNVQPHEINSSFLEPREFDVSIKGTLKVTYYY